MKFLLSPYSRDLRIWVSTVLKLISLKTEIARSVNGPKLQGPRAEDAKAKPYLELQILVTCLTADHKDLNDNCESRNNHRYAIVVQDPATQWIQSYPCKNKTSQETQRSLQKFLEPDRKPKDINTDHSLDFGKSCEDLSWNHCTSTPHRSETNGIAERAVRRVKEGTSAVLLQSGLNESWWADSLECYTYVRNVTDLLSDGKTPNEKRFGQPLKGPIIPFSSLVEYHPFTAKDQSRIHQFGKKVLPSGSFIYRHHVEPRVKLYSPRGESFPFPLKYIDVSRTTHTNLDVRQEKRIDEYWNIDGCRDLSDPWTGVTQFTLLEEKAPDGYMWSGWRLTRKQHPGQIIHGQTSGKQWGSMKQKWSHKKLHLNNARKLQSLLLCLVKL